MTAVLFTCAGQRVDIVSAFARAGATTIAADLDPLAPALYHADHRRSSRASTTRATSPALAALVARARRPARRAAHRPRPGDRLGARATRSRRRSCSRRAPRCAATMGDKYLAHRFFEEHGIAEPAHAGSRRRARTTPAIPLLVKVREGFGSRHIYRADDARRSSRSTSRHTPVDSMVQERCLGEEFSIDVFCDLDGRCLNAIPRSMIQSKGGESIKGRSLQDAELIEHGARVAETIGIVGPANIQCFREPDGSPAGHRRQPALRRRVPAAARRGQPLPGARARARPRRAARAAARRLPRGRRDDALLLRPLPRRGRRRELVPFAEELPQPVAAEPGGRERTSSPAPPGSSARTSPRRSSPRATTSSALDSFTDYYDPARKRENAERLDVVEADLATADLDACSTASTASTTSPASRACGRASAPDFEHYVQRNVLASGGCSRPRPRRGVRVVFASSSSIYGDAESYPTARGRVPRPISPYGVTKLCVEHLAYAHARTTGLDAVVRPLLHGLRPAAAARHGVHAAARGARRRASRSASTATARSRGASRSSPTRSAGPIAAMERGASGETYNIGGGEEATMRDAIALAEEIAGRELAGRAPRRPRRATCGGRAPT